MRSLMRDPCGFTQVLNGSSCCLLVVCHNHARISVTANMGRLLGSTHAVAVECLY